LELFIQDLVLKSVEISKAHSCSTLLPQHLCAPHRTASLA
jgi:hypothetical protein